MLTNTTLHTPRILLLEENPLFRKMIHTMLEILGAKCFSPTQPEEALERFQEGCDLVLLDLGLSHMSGFEMAQRMRSIEKLPEVRTPIIGNSVVANPEEVKQLCLSAGMDDLCGKIADLDSLSQLLTQWLSRPLVMPMQLLDVHVPNG